MFLELDLAVHCCSHRASPWSHTTSKHEKRYPWWACVNQIVPHLESLRLDFKLLGNPRNQCTYWSHYLLEYVSLLPPIATLVLFCTSIVLLNQLIHFKLGFPWAIRVAAFLSTGGFLVGNLLITIPPLPPSLLREEKKPSNFKEYLTWPLILTAIGSGFVAQLGVYFPISYGQLFALRHGLPPQVAFYSLAMAQFGGMIGKVLLNYLSDRYGTVNTMIVCFTCAGAYMDILVSLSIWQPETYDRNPSDCLAWLR